MAQAFAVKHKATYPNIEYPHLLRELVRHKCGALSGDAEADERIRRARQSRKLKAVGEEINGRLEEARRHLIGRPDPFEGLARLPFKLFLTTNADDQLERALRDRMRFEAVPPALPEEPISEVCRWHNRPGQRTLPPPADAEVEAWSIESPRPLVYHLFGKLEYPDSLVLTEDDYFDFLRGPVGTGMQWRFPTAIRATLQDSALIFLGFRMDAWDFRVLYRSLLAQFDDQRLPQGVNHIAVQLDPEEVGADDADHVRESLKQYFADAHIQFFWGRVEEFIQEFGTRYQAAST